MSLLNRDIDCLIVSRSADHKSPGLTLIEITIVLAIVGILAGAAVPAYIGYVGRARVQNAIADITTISLAIDQFIGESNTPPADLAAVGQANFLDPWGNPYQFYNVVTATGNGQLRKDQFLVPINSDYDLYSMGEDGQSSSPLTAAGSRDDIIRANDGQYVGLAIAF